MTDKNLGLRTDPKDDPDGITYEILSWDDFEALCDEVAKQIKKSKKHFDLMLVVLRGGERLGKKLKKDFPDLPMDLVGVRRFHGVDEGKEPELYQRPKTNLKGKKVLVVEDVMDYRITMEYLITKVLKESKYMIAALHQKDDPNNLSSLKADFVGKVMPKIWVHYPWEDGEFMVEKLAKSWNRPGRAVTQNIQTLMKIGFSKSRIRKALLVNEKEMRKLFAWGKIKYEPGLVKEWQEQVRKLC